ncbi:acyl carrier protein [Algibacter amylolyticus]|uniref:Acyl carrier protein n=1 Tax=Algibacter amylolyticus TaxID=1608400 RepID=A0A5M7BDI0_9FLAO|nr:acyl carrier protein [Algibacter amylolyticus]KAA5825604.1 acyl carrier protein [Algibacter amylolyticus]MBB5268170.1 acyl carrier protein [Algibacter amylolyticus]TSJ79902.1 acyl carrier protein [Algibacter amylolyticus]
MNEEDIKLKIRAAFVKVLEHENFVLNNDTTANDVEDWGSVTHMMIITEIEQDFNIKFKLMDLMNMNNIGDLIKAIQSKLI